MCKEVKECSLYNIGKIQCYFAQNNEIIQNKIIQKFLIQKIRTTFQQSHQFLLNVLLIPYLYTD